MNRTASELLDKVRTMDLYKLLEVREDATKEVITKAYRKKALKCHPDKNPDDPKAAETFHTLTLTLQILTDDKAKSLYDSFHRAKKAAEARNSLLDSKRKKFKEDLEARETLFKPAKPAAAPSEPSMSQFEREVERLRKQGSKWVEEEQERMREEIRRKNQASALHSARSAVSDGPQIKVRWGVDRNDVTNGGVTENYLMTVFSQHGHVNCVVLSHKKKGSAIVEFRSRQGAEAAFKAENGRNFQLEWMAGEKPVNTAASTTVTATAPRPAMPHTSSHEDFEKMILRRMEEEAARRRAAATT